MNAVDWMIVFFVGLWAVAAVVYLVRNGKKGGCSCSGCSGCTQKDCDGCAAKDRSGKQCPKN